MDELLELFYLLGLGCILFGELGEAGLFLLKFFCKGLELFLKIFKIYCVKVVLDLEVN